MGGRCTFTSSAPVIAVPEPPLRVVLDTNIALSALLSRGASHELVNLAVRHSTRILLGASEENRTELLQTLRKARLAARLCDRGVTPEQLYALYCGLTDPPVPSAAWQGHWSRDPDDDAFLATTFAFGAHLLVTRDDDLLSLKHF